MKRTLFISLVGLFSLSIVLGQEKRVANYSSGKQLTQTATTKRYAAELNTHLTNYQLVELHATSIYNQALREQGRFQFHLQMDEVLNWDITVEKSDVRSADYKFIVLGPNGREELPRSPTITYKGFVNGDPANTIRMSITPDYISALFMDGNHLYNIEPITQYIQNAAPTHYVVYENSAIKTSGLQCGTVTTGDKQSLLRMNKLKKEGANLSTSACAQAEVALAATSDLVIAKGNGTKTSTETYLIDFFNRAEFYYDKLNIKNILTGIVVSLTTQTNMTNATNPVGLRSEFANWAITGKGFAGIKHDIGSLITSKGKVGGLVGLAEFPGLCYSDETWHYHWADVTGGAITLAHEWGHVWGAPHDNANHPTYPTANSCPTRDCVMMPSPSGPNWSPQILEYMEALKNGQAASCLSPCSPVIPYVSFSSDLISSCSGSLTVNFTDHSWNSPTSWNWDFGDGGTSTLQNPSHTYNVEGKFTVKLTVSNAAGSKTETYTNYITVGSGGFNSLSQKTGPLDQNVGTLAQFSSVSFLGMLFKVEKRMKLNSILVITGDTAGKREFIITDTAYFYGNAPVIYDTIVDLPANSNVRVNFKNWNLVPGNYILQMVNTFGNRIVNTMRNRGGIIYPYSINGLISIYNNYFAYLNKQPPVQWYIGYDWEVQDLTCINPANTPELNGNHTLSISPNPSNGLFTLYFNTNKEEKSNLEVYNMLGEKVFTRSIILGKDKNETINLSEQSKGVYLIRIVYGRHQMLQRIIKE